jgi:hypothetical protein
MDNKIDLEMELTKSLRMGQVKSDIKGGMSKLNEEEIDNGNTKYVFIFGVREDGSCYMRSLGEISELEANGLKVMIEESVETVIDFMYDDLIEENEDEESV